ncbi:hypothetical protein [Peijinzhouia sedimentorum]
MTTGLILLYSGLKQYEARSFYDNTIFESGIFDYIRKENQKSGRIEYRIKTIEQSVEYKILSFTRKSFNYEAFIAQVEKGDKIELYLVNSKDSNEIAQLTHQGVSYIDQTKRNNSRKMNGLYGAIGGGLFIVFGVWNLIKTKLS